MTYFVNLMYLNFTVVNTSEFFFSASRSFTHWTCAKVGRLQKTILRRKYGDSSRKTGESKKEFEKVRECVRQDEGSREHRKLTS